MKKIISFCMGLGLFASMSLAAEIGITFNGEKLVSDVPPIEIKDRVMVPIRVISEKAGATVDFNYDTNEVTLTNNTAVVKLTVNSNVAYVNGNKKVLDVPATEINNRTLVPIRFVGEALGLNVHWEDETVKITTVSPYKDADLSFMLSIQEKSKLNTDRRSAEQIGKAIRIWLTDGDATERQRRENLIKDKLVKYSEVDNSLDLYISLGYVPQACKYADYYVMLEDGCVKIMVATSLDEANSLKDSFFVYDAVGSGWAYIEGTELFVD